MQPRQAQGLHRRRPNAAISGRLQGQRVGGLAAAAAAAAATSGSGGSRTRRSSAQQPALFPGRRVCRLLLPASWRSTCSWVSRSSTARPPLRSALCQPAAPPLPLPLPLLLPPQSLRQHGCRRWLPAPCMCRRRLIAYRRKAMQYGAGGKHRIGQSRLHKKLLGWLLLLCYTRVYQEKW